MVRNLASATGRRIQSILKSQYPAAAGARCFKVWPLAVPHGVEDGLVPRP